MLKLKESEKVDILKHLYSIQTQELMFRREREFKIFSWSTTLFIGLIVILLVLKKDEIVAWRMYGIGGRLTATVTAMFLGMFSIGWQNRERRLGNRHASVIAKINKIFHCFEEGYFEIDSNEALYPKRWINWGGANISSFQRYFRANLVTATWFLCFLGVLMIWIT